MAQKRNILDELTTFRKELKSYKRWLDSKKQLSEAQERYRDSLREKLVRKASKFRELITEITGKDTEIIYEFGKPRSVDIWTMGLRSEFDYRTAETLSACIDTTNSAIGKLELAIEMGIRDEQGNIIGEPPKDTVESPANLFDKMQFHPRVIEVSESLFKTGNYSSAIFEAFKAVHNYVQDKTGLTLDGVNLMEKVFNENKPILQLTELLTKSDRDEQKGFKYLFMGSQMGIRNPQAHENVKPEEQNIALEYLGIASLLMRRIDGSKLVKLNI